MGLKFGVLDWGGRWVLSARFGRFEPVAVGVLQEGLLRHHRMDALGPVDHLGHSEIHRDAREGVGPEEIPPPEFREQRRGLLDGHAHGLVEVGVQPEGDVMRR